MLVLSRKPQERIQIGDNITIVVVEVKSGRVRLGIEAPKDIRVKRAEVPDDPTTVPEEAAEQLRQPKGSSDDTPWK